MKLLQQLKDNKKSPSLKLLKDCLLAFGFTLEQNSGKSTHYTISIDIPNFFEAQDNRTIVVHGKDLIPPYGKRALNFIERKIDYDEKN